MNRLRFSTVVTATVLLVLPLSGEMFAGSDFRTGEHVVLGRGEVHDGWYFASGEFVLIEGTVNGDLYAAGGKVTVTGKVIGDVIAAGGEITISGSVSDDVRAAGGTLTIDGTVGKDVTAAGGTVKLGRGGVVSGNMLVAGGNIDLDGTVGGDVRAGAGNLTLAGSVGKDIDFAGSAVTVVSGARVNGDAGILIDDPDQASIAEGTVGGVVHIMVEESSTDSGLSFWWSLYWTVSLLLLGLILSFLAPKQLSSVGRVIASRTGESFLWGLIALFGIPALAAVLLVTIVGIPLGMFLLAIFLFLLYVSHLGAGVFVGRMILRKREGEGLALFGMAALGVVAVQVLLLVPVLCWLILAAVVVGGLGATVIVLRETARIAKETNELPQAG